MVCKRDATIPGVPSKPRGGLIHDYFIDCLFRRSTFSGGLRSKWDTGTGRQRRGVKFQAHLSSSTAIELARGLASRDDLSTCNLADPMP